MKNRATVTTPEHIKIVLGEESDGIFSSSDKDENRRVIDDLRWRWHDQLCGSGNNIVSKPITRTVLTMDAVRDALAKEPGNSLLKCQTVFGKGGVA